MMHNIKTSSQELKSYHKMALKQIPLKYVPREPRRKGALPPPPSPTTRLHVCMCACMSVVCGGAYVGEVYCCAQLRARRE